MNARQEWSIVIGLATFLLAGVFPPFTHHTSSTKETLHHDYEILVGSTAGTERALALKALGLAIPPSQTRVVTSDVAAQVSWNPLWQAGEVNWSVLILEWMLVAGAAAGAFVVARDRIEVPETSVALPRDGIMASPAHLRRGL